MPARPGRHRLVAAQPGAGFFFEADVVTLQKTPERAAAARYSLLVQGRDELFERPIRPLADQREDPVRVVLQRRSAAAAWAAARGALSPPPRLKPFDRRAGADFKNAPPPHAAMLPLQPLRSHARANPMNKPWAWRSSANRIAPDSADFVTPGNPDSNLPGNRFSLRRISAGARPLDR